MVINKAERADAIFCIGIDGGACIKTDVRGIRNQRIVVEAFIFQCIFNFQHRIA